MLICLYEDEYRDSVVSAEDGSLGGILKKDVQDGESVDIQKKNNSWQTNDSNSSLGDATSAGSNSTSQPADKSRGSKDDSLTVSDKYKNFFHFKIS